MVKVHYIKGKKDKSLVYRIIFAVLLIYIFIKVLEILFVSLNLNSYNISKINLGMNFYKMAVDSTIPSLSSCSSEKEEVFKVGNSIMEKLIGINFNRFNTLIDSTIPIIGYVNKRYAVEYGFAKELVPVSLDKGDKTFNNNEDYYAGTPQDEVFKVSPTKQQYTNHVTQQYTLQQLKNLEFLTRHLYTVDHSIDVKMNDFPIDYFLNKDLTTDLKSKEPKILIFHTHSQENFTDSRPQNMNDTVVGVGDELVSILRKKYGISVIHDKGHYDVANGKLSRGPSYERMEPAIREILNKYPSIEVVIDLHRDGVPNNVKLVTNINGKRTAKIMFFNGLCKKRINGVMTPIKYLKNPYIKDNMSFSFRMQLKAKELYPNFTRKIYLKAYRYSLHMKPKSLMVEVGAQTNTVQEAKNAMEPLAQILYQVLTGK